ncbi:hypothetical protein ACRE_037500 [Hapsidospora chrysogenum ATCC 11550]|uniref:RRM domain-containing protein n=1 Tax=Hapsidospora chrysogenum (strain ATCC 11550 / CBS 779.69 / DSM 880 / IAM 14645 / JCM 23072 / IMI 49137) TaxID=857340 RepID=A0A086T7U2_HAPC1|nr:hypothetical protein ACRE_037500 [Hapsidospora chrysogenum ATCC 11550]
MSKATVHVKNIATATSDDEVREFFSFCGKIADLKVTEEGESKSADVTFEKDTAAKTALLLNNTQLGANHITVTSAAGDTGDEGSHFDKSGDRSGDEITQEEKPRARILAEYLAQGYVIGDAAIQRALELDQKHGVSSRFMTTLQSLDSKYHASDRAKATDETYRLSQRATNFFTGLGSYFEKATNTPTGKKIVQFYTDSEKQVREVHAEARRLAELKKEEHGGSAYKASGLERVFGKEKPAEDKPAEEKPFDAAAAAAQSTAEGSAPGTTNPTPVVATEPVPGVEPTSEKK